MIAAADAIDRLTGVLGGSPAARLAASALVEADQLGLPRFGTAMLDEWKADAVGMPRNDTLKSVRWVDASACFAPVAVAGATLELIEAAQHSGIAAVFLRGVKGFGRLAPFVRRIADEGLIGMAGAEGPPFVCPLGGTRPVIGTNPFAFAMGTGSDRTVIDVATSTATMADIRNARTSGAPLLEGVAVDHSGKPTTFADRVAALLPRGGQLGSLLGLTVELLAGIAGGGRDDPGGRGVFLIAIDPEKSGGQSDWRAKLAGLRTDWIVAGGHWPRGGKPDAEPILDEEFASRLEAHIARMSKALME